MQAIRKLRLWFSALPLSWQIFLPNVAVLLIAVAVLILTPASVPRRVTSAQAQELLVALVLLVLVNLFLIRRTVGRLRKLTELMTRIDPLAPGQRAPTAGGSAEATKLAAVFNAMLDRLETERREVASKMLEAQERERVRLARELHDEIGQSVTALMLELDLLAGRAPAAIRGELAETREAARAISGELGEIVHRLRPEVLDDLGLESAIVALSENFTDQFGIPVERHVERGLPPLSESAELVAYRVAQEALTNVARHAGATRVRLDLVADGGEILLAVADDGIGPDGIEPGSGIQGMRERAVLIGAELAIERGPEGGVRVALRLPIEKGAAVAGAGEERGR